MSPDLFGVLVSWVTFSNSTKGAGAMNASHWARAAWMSFALTSFCHSSEGLPGSINIKLIQSKMSTIVLDLEGDAKRVSLTE
jgi:hypothetical protein